MYTNLQAEPSKSSNGKTTVKIYKTEPGDYYEITATSSAFTQSTQNIQTILSPAASRFYEQCLNKPVYCDMSDPGNTGVAYIFCETTNKLGIKTATIDIDNENNFTIDYKLWITDALAIPEVLPTLNSSFAYRFYASGKIQDSASYDIQYTEPDNIIGSFIDVEINMKKTSKQRVDNRYYICNNIPVTCTANVTIVPNTEYTGENPLSKLNYTFDFVLSPSSFTWDEGGNLVALSTSYEQNLGNNQIAEIAITMNQLTNRIIVDMAIRGQNVINNTLTIISSNNNVVSENPLPLSNFNTEGTTQTLGGWAAYTIFSDINFDVSFSSTSPGIVQHY